MIQILRLLWMAYIILNMLYLVLYGYPSICGWYKHVVHRCMWMAQRTACLQKKGPSPVTDRKARHMQHLSNYLTGAACAVVDLPPWRPRNFEIFKAQACGGSRIRMHLCFCLLFLRATKCHTHNYYTSLQLQNSNLSISVCYKFPMHKMLCRVYNHIFLHTTWRPTTKRN